MSWTVALVVAAVVFPIALFVGIFRLVAAMRERAIQKLSEQGLEKRSGPRRLHLKLTGYASKSGWRSGQRSIKPGELVLTTQTLNVVFPMPLPLGGKDLSNATGRVEVSFDCEDADDWLVRLAARGATTLLGGHAGRDLGAT
jgi:hypothetical protein